MSVNYNIGTFTEYPYKGLRLSERCWTCQECGTHHDWDFNAAHNIKEFGLKAWQEETGREKIHQSQKLMPLGVGSSHL